MRIGRSSLVGTGIVLAVLVASCAPAAPDAPRSTAGQMDTSPTRGPSRVVAAMMGQPSSLVARFNTGQISVPGAGVLEQLVNASLSEYNEDGGLQPQLA